ncbi:FxLYD domain-containing protein [Microbispora sp. ATCC PTA-5024]|uniref:FxLYD domain-containing protein n=1 Tax=Microbispora sp. ATCC PTA-5024 TaxID=316330 RepID=UPI0003DC7FAF|nr:FxLYD domain-containing protein [Microbispora sp. ATCC PTA-5024]ETK35364.1 hypothetical protein MPTA5024_14550 [Microbispora sp. ATCC PTA-5024]
MTIALAAIAVAMAGCAREDTSPDLRPLAVEEQASSISQSGAGYVVSWAGLLANPNRWHFGENASAVISAVDAAGKEVVHMEQPLDAVPPGRTLPFSGQVVATGKPVRVTIRYRPASWRPTPRIPSAFLAFPVSDILTEKVSNGSYLVTGYVTDPFAKAAPSLSVTALLRDAAGKLLGGATSYVDRVAPGARRRFVITVDGLNGAKVARTDITAGTWGATAKPYVDLVRGGAAPLHTVMPSTEPFEKDRGYQPMADRRQ